MKVADIDSDGKLIQVRDGKGGKDRTVMLSPQLLGILRTYWRLARPEIWLFPGRGDKPIDVQVLHAACRAATKAAGLVKRVSVHTLRPSFATHLLENGVDILHTWGQALTHHPHIHCLVPGGALVDGERWLACRPRFFFTVHVLSRLFRRLFLERLQTAHLAGRLRFSGTLAGRDDAGAFATLVRQLRRKDWIVFSKPPFGSPEHVLAYLGRYTHRVAIANSRLIRADDTAVSFRWRDYRRGNTSKVMTLAPEEFIRRFLIHSLPNGFHRIRHYGFLANGCHKARLATIRRLLPPPKANGAELTVPAATVSRALFDPTICPCCGGALRIVAALPRLGYRYAQPCPDTS